MVQDAEANKEGDSKRKELVDARNQADALVHQTEKSIVDLGDKVSEEDKTNIQSAIDGLKETLKDENASKEQIDEKVKVLTEVSHKLSEEAYKNDQSSTEEKKKDDDDIIDAEVE